MSNKKAPSKVKKDRFTSYKANNTAAKNKVKKLVRHLNSHPDDAQSRSRKKTSGSGRSHEKNTPLQAKMARYMRHISRFGNL